MATRTPPHTAVYYPESDGQPMAETDVHRDQMTDLILTLRQYYRSDANVYVSGNLLLYYVEGDPRRSVAPDVFVVQGVPSHRRRIYKLWEEGRSPDVVFEITSSSTRREDLDTKRGLYERLEVQEYFLFDPLGDYLRPRLQGHRLIEGHYEPVEPLAAERLPSEVLGLQLRVREDQLRLYDPLGQRWLPTPADADEARRLAEAHAAVAEARALTEAAARQEAEARAAAAEVELARLRKQLDEGGRA